MPFSGGCAAVGKKLNSQSCPLFPGTLAPNKYADWLCTLFARASLAAAR